MMSWHLRPTFGLLAWAVLPYAALATSPPPLRVATETHKPSAVEAFYLRVRPGAWIAFHNSELKVGRIRGRKLYEVQVIQYGADGVPRVTMSAKEAELLMGSTNKSVLWRVKEALIERQDCQTWFKDRIWEVPLWPTD